MIVRIAIFFLLLGFSGACVNHDLAVVTCEQSGLALITDDISPATSCSATDGSIVVSAKGGVQPYVYVLNGGEQQPTGEFNDLPIGVYSVTVTDKNKCQVVLENVLVGAEHFLADITATPDTECLDGNASIGIDVQEPNGPYEFALDEGDFQSGTSFFNVQEGTHFISVKDNAACTVILQVDVPRGATGVSWATDILPIMTTTCATSGCHNGTSRLDWRDYSKVKQYAADIKARTQDKSMPLEGGLPQNQIDLITCWVDDGALEN